MNLIGILIVSHGNFAEELLKSAELIVGEQKQVKTLGLYHGDSVEQFFEEVSSSIKELEEGEGVLVLVDLFGGSPSNVTAASLKNINFESLTGVNLPMLLETLCLRKSYPINDLIKLAMEAGVKGVRDIKSVLESKE